MQPKNGKTKVLENFWTKNTSYKISYVTVSSYWKNTVGSTTVLNAISHGETVQMRKFGAICC